MKALTPRHFANLLVLVLIISGTLRAQEPANLPALNSIPQSNLSNPATELPYRFWIGIPALSGVYLGFSNTGFRYKDVIYRTPDDSLHVDIDGFLDGLDELNYLSVDVRAELLALGIRFRNTRVEFRISERSATSFSYSKDLMRFLFKLNGAFINEEASFAGTGINSTLFHEASFGISRKLNDKWRVGSRFKFLSGVYNIYSRKTDISLYTDASNAYELSLQSDIEINTSIPGLEATPDDSLGMPISSTKLVSDLKSIKNPGFALDLGVQYRLNDKINLGLSLTDLGFIAWKNNTRSYVSAHSSNTFVFDGIDIAEYLTNDSASFSNQLSKVLDSLKTSMGLVTRYDHYVSPLVTRLHVQGDYALTEKTRFGALLRMDFFNQRVRPTLTLHANQAVGRWFQGMLSYSVSRGNFVNPGAGFMLKWAGFQFYLLSDNLTAFIDPKSFKTVNFQFGMNLCFGDKRFREQL